MNNLHSFSWVVPNVLAAMSRPYDSVRTMEFLKDEGISVIITLTEEPLSEAVVEEFGFAYHHIPVADFAAPTARQIDQFIRVVEKARKTGAKSVVHCLAGRGRTGTMLACYLVSQGCSAAEAIQEIRATRPGSIETYEQESAIRRYARRTCRKPPRH